MLNPTLFQRVMGEFQVTPDIALFASRINSLCHPLVKKNKTKPPSAGMATVRQAIQARSLSNGVTDIIMQSWRPATQTQYSTYLKRWEKFCSDSHLDPIHASARLGLEFLSSLFDGGLGFSVLSTAKYMLSATSALDSGTFREQSLVKRFMLGVFNARPSLPRYTATSDAGIVLDYLSDGPGAFATKTAHLEDSNADGLSYQSKGANSKIR